MPERFFLTHHDTDLFGFGHSGVEQIALEYNEMIDGERNNGKWGIPYETIQGNKRCYFAYYSECKNTRNANDQISEKQPYMLIQKRHSKAVWQLRSVNYVAQPKQKNYEIHHVHKVKDLKGKELREQVMIAKLFI